MNPRGRLTIPTLPLTQSTFASFGTVIENSTRATPSNYKDAEKSNIVSANQGTALKFLDVSNMQNLYDAAPSGKSAKAVMNMFVCAPRMLKEHFKNEEGRGKCLFEVNILERHPYTPQTFVPLGLSVNDSTTKYLVIVAPTLPLSYDKHFLATDNKSGPPDLTHARAFIAHGNQGVTYAAGTWHSPMAVLGEKHVDFVVVQFANGVEKEDCEEVEITGSLSVEMPQPFSEKGRRAKL